MNSQKKSVLYSVFGALFLIVFWVYVNQLKNESQLPFWDVIDFANETSAETTQENTEYPPATQQTDSTSADQNQNSLPVPSEPTNPTPQTQPPVSTPTPVPTPTPIPTPTPVVAKPLGPYKDGTYQATSYTPWGDVSISIIVKNGQWANIRYIQIPDSPPSQYASSYLARQALQAQNASIDGVSGATYVTEAFRDDLNQIVQQSKA